MPNNQELPWVHMSLVIGSDNFSFMNHSSIYNVYTIYVHEYLYIYIRTCIFVYKLLTYV